MQGPRSLLAVGWGWRGLPAGPAPPAPGTPGPRPRGGGTEGTAATQYTVVIGQGQQNSHPRTSLRGSSHCNAALRDAVECKFGQCISLDKQRRPAIVTAHQSPRHRMPCGICKQQIADSGISLLYSRHEHLGPLAGRAVFQSPVFVSYATFPLQIFHTDLHTDPQEDHQGTDLPGRHQRAQCKPPSLGC